MKIPAAGRATSASTVPQPSPGSTTVIAPQYIPIPQEWAMWLAPGELLRIVRDQLAEG